MTVYQFLSSCLKASSLMAFLIFLAVTMTLAMKSEGVAISNHKETRASNRVQQSMRKNNNHAIFPVTLPQGTMEEIIEEATTQRNREKRDDRELYLQDRQPTGFMIKFHSCSPSDESYVLLEGCLDYRNGFGDACGVFTVRHEQWVEFHHKYIILQMVKDFCDVCETECHGDIYAHKTMPDICAIRIWDDDDTYCNTLCSTYGNFEGNDKAVNDTKKTIAKELMSQCFSRGIKSCHVGENLRSLVLDDMEEHCPEMNLWELWELWIGSCDAPGYPFIFDAIADSHGPAWLHCSFQGEGSESSLLVGKFCEEFREQLLPCDGRGWTHYDAFDNEEQPLPKMHFSCVLQPEPTQSPTQTPLYVAPDYHKDVDDSSILKKEGNDPLEPAQDVVTKAAGGGTSSPRLTFGVGTNALPILMGGIIAGVFIIMFVQRKASSVIPSNRHLVASNRETDEAGYCQILEMNELSLT